MSPGPLLGAASAVVYLVAVALGLNYRMSFEATAGPVVVTLLVGMALGMLSLVVAAWSETRTRGLQVPPDLEDRGLPVPLGWLWLPWALLGGGAAAVGTLLGSRDLLLVGTVWALLGGMLAVVSHVHARRRLHRLWRVPTDAALLTPRTVAVARRLLADRRRGSLAHVAVLPNGRLPATVAVSSRSGAVRETPVDSVADGALACLLAGVEPVYAGRWEALRGRPEAPTTLPDQSPPAGADRQRTPAAL